MDSSETETDESGHHPPAVADWPRGFGEASWWPIVTAVGVVGMYGGAGLFVLAFGDEPLFSPVYGPFVFVLGTGLFIVGVYGWTYHGFIAQFWSHIGDDDAEYRWGMLLFLVTDLGTFGAVVAYYLWIRAGTWPPGELPELLSSLVAFNTVLLLASSVTMHIAHVRLHEDDRRGFLGWLAATQLLGTIFLGGQMVEYYGFLVREGFSLASGLYGSAFYGLTGLHGLHVMLGLVLIGIVLIRSVAGQYSPQRDTSVTVTAMYWHFVDAVWVFLVVSLYVGAAVS